MLAYACTVHSVSATLGLLGHTGPVKILLCPNFLKDLRVDRAIPSKILLRQQL